VVGFCGQVRYCNSLCYFIVSFQPAPSHKVSAKLLLNRSRPMSCKPTHMGPMTKSECGQHEQLTKSESIVVIRPAGNIGLGK